MDAERDDSIYGEVPVDLLRTLSGDGPTFHIIVSDDAMAAGAELERAELQIEVAHLSTQDDVAVTLDGEALGPPRIRDAAAEDPEDPSDVSENGWLIWPLEQVARGVCEVRVYLLERDPRIGVPLRIEQVEIYLQYRH